MVPFSYIFVGMLGATLVPAYVSLYLVPSLRSVNTRYLAAAGVGLAFWFFYDTMADTGSLLVNDSVYPPSLFGGLQHWGVIGAFVAGIVTLAVFDHFAVQGPGPGAAGAGGGSTSPRLFFLIPAAIAAVMGIHGLGEGWDAASAVAGATTGSNSLIGSLVQALGTVPAALSYPIHKFLEAAIVGAAYAGYVYRSDGAVEKRWWDIPLLGLLFGGPSVVGAAAGYFVPLDTTYFFAFGVTSALYAALRLAEAVGPGFKIGVNAPSYLGPRAFFALAAGFFLLYTAALLH